MSDGEKRTPELRLNGFEGEWVEKPLGESFSERVQSDENGELLSVTVRTGVRKFSEIGRHDTSNADKSKYKLVEVGDIAYNSMRMWQGASGRSPYRGIVSPAYTVLAPEAGVESGFFARLFKTPEMIATFEKNSQGLTSDTWNLKYPALSKIEAHMPELSEQKAISATFDNVEKLIDASEARHEALKHLRQTMLVKMFPQGDEREPEIRFDGFEGEWDKADLGQLASFSKGAGFAKKDLCSSGHPIVLYGRLYTAYEFELDELDTFVDMKSHGVLSQGGEVLVPASGESEEEIARAAALLTPGVLIGGDLNVIRPVEGVDPSFLALTLSNGDPHGQIAQRAQGKTVVHVRNGDLAEVIIQFPSIEEQRIIVSYFRSLDELIDAESTKVEKLRNLKSALLEKMFV